MHGPYFTVYTFFKTTVIRVFHTQRTSRLLELTQGLSAESIVRCSS